MGKRQMGEGRLMIARALAYPKWWLLFLVAATFDTATTIYAVYGVGGVELNPIAKALGVSGFLAFKVGVSVILTVYAYRRRATKGIMLGTLLTFAVVCWNLSRIVVHSLE
jgi:hypothetical protein